MSKNLKILFNYFLYFFCLIFICIIGISKVFAFEYTYSVVDDIYSHTEQLVSTTYGGAPFTNPRNSGYAFSDVFQVDYIVSNYTFNANTNYQLESHLPDQVFTNVNTYKVSGLNGESCMTSYSNSILNNDHYPRWAFQCPHQTNTITITIYNSSNKNLWSGTGIFNWSSAVLWSSSSSMTSSDTNSIINNQNQNTQDIINNNNQNTQDIINNQNELLGSKCENLFQFNLIQNGNIYIGLTATKKNNGVYNFKGTASSNFLNLSNISYFNDNVYFSPNTKLFTNNYYVNNNSDYTIIYDNSNNITFIRLTTGQYYDFDIPFTISKNDYINSYCEYGSYSSKLDDTNNSINNLDDTLKDDNVDQNGVADAFESFNDYLDDNSTITQLITLPITLYTAILNNLNGTCSPFNLGKLYGEDLILPCINISQYLGNSLWTMIDIIISGFAVYAISKKMIKVFNNFSSLREGDVIDD